MKINKTNKKFYHIRYDKILAKIDFGFCFVFRINPIRKYQKPKLENRNQNRKWN
jgi:hypothetical protein